MTDTPSAFSKLLATITGVLLAPWRMINSLTRWLHTVGRYVDPVLMLLVAGASIGILSYWAYEPLWHLITQKRIEMRIAAGKKDGSSYIIANALKVRLEHKYKGRVHVQVMPTQGTDENLQLLRQTSGKGAPFAHLGSAQADVALRHWLNFKMSGGVLAALYLDKFQLVTCSRPSAEERQIVPATEVLRREVPQSPIAVRLPVGGGQEVSFDELAKKFGLVKDLDYRTIEDSRQAIPLCGEAEYGNLIFRVRAEGHVSIARALARGWRLVDFSRTSAIWAANPTLTPSEIPPGRFLRPGLEDRSPVPSLPLSTIAVPRLFVARSDHSLPSWLIYETTQILHNEAIHLARKAPEKHQQLLLNIPHFNTKDRLYALGIPIHTVALKFYDPTLSFMSWFSAYADAFSLAVTLLTLTAGGLLAVNRWLVWWRRNNVSNLVRRVTHEMAMPENTIPFAGIPQRSEYESKLEPEVDYLRDEIARCDHSLEQMSLTSAEEQIQIRNAMGSLAEMHLRHAKLSAIFSEASELFINEHISEDSFSSFNDAYRTALDSVLRKMDDQKRAISEIFVGKFIEVARSASGAKQELIDPNHAHKIFNEASSLMGQKLVYSRDSLRTLTDAYDLAAKVLQNASSKPEQRD
ncbi:MAG: hypothetical protein KTR25_09600 [Myxococcales bacterium]|nr:hypothetical protein [Myxococcales bacterium]